jgi:hypothetical protein
MRSLALFRRMRWLHVTTALLLVLGTSTPGWAHMSCLMGCHDEWQIGQAEDHCTDDCCEGAEEAQGATLRTACCDLDQYEADRTDFVPQSTIQFQVPVTEAVSFVQTLVPLGPTAAHVEHISTRPPPLSGSSLAIANRTLLL